MYYTVNVPSGLRPCVRYTLSITHSFVFVNNSLGLFLSNSLELSFVFCTRFFVLLHISYDILLIYVIRVHRHAIALRISVSHIPCISK